MKKKLEAELISIAHRILKLKNRADIEQLQQETLRLYEKLSVLKFVEDNFADVKPTIGAASAEEKLEEIYNLEATQEPTAGEKEEVKEEKTADKKANKEEEAVVEEPVAEAETEEEVLEEEVVTEVKEEAAPVEAEKEEEAEEPQHKIEIEKSAEELQAIEESAVAVFEKEQDSTIEEEEMAADAEIETIEPEKDVKVEESNLAFDFAFERKAAPEEPKKEITFEDFHLEYKEPEFIKKSDLESKPKEELKPEYAIAQIEVPKEEIKEAPKQEVVEELKAEEPIKEEPKAEIIEEVKVDEVKEEPKPEPVKEEPKFEIPKYEAPAAPAKSINDSFGKVITLGLNDRIAFEKHLFAGSGEDLNRVVSQLNTINTFQEAKDFIDDLVKPDYNNWQGKEEYEERFMHLVEKKFD
jgi:hypothetical protein